MSAIEQLNIYTLSGNSQTNISDIYNLASSGGHLNSYSLEMFLVVCPEFKNLFDDNVANRYNMLFSLYYNEGKQKFGHSLYGDNSVICLSWYIAHYLQVTLNNTKNVGNNANLNPANLPNNMTYNVGGKDEKTRANLNGLQEDLYRTSYGRTLYEYMKVVGQNNVRGVY